MLKARLAKLAIAQLALPIVFLPNKNESLRLCVDNRRPNAVLTQDSYSMPRMDECIDSLKKARKVSTLDAGSSYWLIKMDG